MSKSSKFFLLLSFSLSFSLGLVFLNLISPSVQAADVNISALVGATCGDGVIQTPNDNGVNEACDDGNTINCDGCKGDCTRLDAVCGDIIAECGETCDGGASSGVCYNQTCNSDCTCPACGDGIIGAGEECESDANCSAGYFCNSSCRCQIKGAPCIPGATVCSWGPCVGGVQSGFCSNGCSSWSVIRSCYVPGCGNGTLDPGEECDDGNTIPGDGCSATCQLEVGCGNGILDPGEECDDDNIISGDCCSSTCRIEILITNITESVADTSATISWQTPCQSTVSLLEWGTTPAVNDGSVSGLSGSNYSYTITGLDPNTTYYYRITATAGALQAIATGSFHTLGGVENCNNGLDDDSDGFCDYPASTCTDGSTPGDPECICTPNFVCTPIESCRPDGLWTVACVDQTVPKCRLDYEMEEPCGCVLPCGSCQHPDENCLVCLPDPSPCCGNGICEPPSEDPYSCPLDCPVECLSDWECTPWQPEPCPPIGIQTRECFDKNACPIPINPPPTVQSCGALCPGLSCGTCEQINLEQCICEALIPCCGNGVCESGESHEQCPADCIQPCLPNWTCLGWGPCVNGSQRRECYDLNNCGLNLDRPPEVRSCQEGCDIACNLCQQLDLATCSCLAIVPCCGNHACELGESIWSCPVDCGLPPDIRIFLPQCLDGLDNDKDGFVDFPADPGCTIPLDNSELNLAEIINAIAKFLQDKFLDNPLVEKVNERIAAPFLVTAIVINTFATFSFFNFLSYLQFLFTQPFAALFRRKRRKWGVVYNSLSKQPVDLAIVRLYQKENSRLVQSRVTDKLGRYSFLVDPGRYYLTVTKPKYNFPTQYLKEAKEDVKYLDLYHGETIEVTEQRAAITLNIPIDPQEEVKPVARIIFQYYLRKVQYAAAFSAVPLATVSMAISPGLLTFSLFGFHCLLYILFRRLGYQKPPKSWGLVYDKKTKKSLVRAIARIYDKQYNKLLETRVTDGRGRYSFLVNNNIYYVTAEKLGYKPHKTDDIDLISKDREAIVGLDIGLEKGGREEVIPVTPPPSVPTPPPVPPAERVGIPAELKPYPPAEKPISKPTPPSVSPPQPQVPIEPSLEEKIKDLTVDRESLEELMKVKEEAKEVKEEIKDQMGELEEMEEKVEEAEESIEEKLEKLDQQVSSPPPEVNQDRLPEKPEEKKDGAVPPPEKSIFG